MKDYPSKTRFGRGGRAEFGGEGILSLRSTVGISYEDKLLHCESEFYPATNLDHRLQPLDHFDLLILDTKGNIDML